MEALFKLNFLTNENEGPIILYITSPNMEGMSERILEIAKQKTKDVFDFCELVVSDWDRYLTPWPVEQGLKGRSFTGEAQILLDFIEKDVIPKISSKFSGLRPVCIAGYSLAGLFSLWTVYQSHIFAGAISCSGSLWYPKWDDFIRKNQINYIENQQKHTDEFTIKLQLVYLSLGKKEPKTKHPLMCQVDECTQLQYEQLQMENSLGEVTFVWHEGGHFDNVENRVAEAIEWISHNFHTISDKNMEKQKNKW